MIEFARLQQKYSRTGCFFLFERTTHCYRSSHSFFQMYGLPFSPQVLTENLLTFKMTRLFHVINLYLKIFVPTSSLDLQEVLSSFRDKCLIAQLTSFSDYLVRPPLPPVFLAMHLCTYLLPTHLLWPWMASIQMKVRLCLLPSAFFPVCLPQRSFL